MPLTLPVSTVTECLRADCYILLQIPPLHEG